MRFLGAPLLLVLIVGPACANNGVHRRITGLETEERRRQAKLAEIEEQIAAAQAEVEYAKADARYQSCLGLRAKLESETAVAKAECVRQLAERGACIARNEASVAKGTGAGCVAGWLAAIVTGGAAAPAVLIGCSGGALLSDASKRECGAPPVCSSVDDPTEEVLRANDLSAPPRCRAPQPVSTPILSRDATASSGNVEPTCERWRIAWVDFEAPARQRNGDAWDPDGSGPDLEYVVVTGRSSVYRSPKYEGNRWRHAPEQAILLSARQIVTIELFDVDLVTSERIASFNFPVPTSSTDDMIERDLGRTTARVKLICETTS